MSQNIRAYQTITTNAGSDITAQLLLVSRLEHTMRIVVCPLVVAVKIYDDVSAKTCLV
jgi:hypothetical protein